MKFVDEATIEVAAGDPAHTLIDIVERHGCDAVIMAAGSGEGELGSVSQHMVDHSPVPVTVVHPNRQA